MTQRKMKDSGVAWIGQVPEGWGVRAFRFEFSFSKGLNITKADLVDEGVPVVSYGQIHAKYNSARHLSDKLLRFVPAAVAERDLDARLNKGDFVFADTSEDVEGAGNFVLNDRDDVVYAGYHDLIARPNDSRNSAYLAYLFQTDAWRSQLRSMVQGIKVFSITQRLFKKISLILPPLSEQRKIAAFLDDECGKIDVLRGKVEKQIAALEEYRKSVITEAVTRGIKRGRKMRSSGVEWMSEVPSGWEMIRIGYLYDAVNERGNDQLPILSVSISSGVSDKQLDDEELDRKVNRSEDKSTYKHVAVGDLTYNQMRAWQGAFGTVTVEGMVSPAYVVCRPKSELNTRFIEYVLRTDAAMREIKRRSTGIVDFRLRLYWPEFKTLKIPYPSADEQCEIASYLDRKCATIDSMVAKCREELDRLTEYKKSLIYEYVTGKKEVA